MTGNWNNLQVPAGVRDLLPAEAAALRKLEQELVAFFQSWGYQEVLTPTFEFVETFQAGSPAGDEGSLYKFIDRQGRVLTLRPEMTAPIARLVATSLRREALPLRLCYSARVFRYEEPQAGRLREFHQAGVELIGAGGEAADGEIIALAVETLLQAGLQDFRLGIGQVAVTKGVLQDLGLPQEAVARIKVALAGKDLVGLERLVNEYNLAGSKRRQLELLATLHGGREALEEARANFIQTGAAAALAGLERVWQALTAYGLEKWLFIDLGILRDFDYYTGIVFEGYVPGLGVPVCGGGRYDGLLGQFGYPCPATGFALGLERVLMARGEGQGAGQGEGYLVAGQDLAAVLRRARELRRPGVMVIIDGQSQNRQEAAARAAARGLALVWVD
ncbi:Histidine-tRNA ligase/ATP phosphoribosyltransferase regulatory subunit [Moorella glycerini]|uniref:ATP phosphoribosyltransferase regulatory subunit n=1 Tax=Neomoorella stamsii TaxID=1266720 RepID=A0A9X7J068_9FIRM|nr:MULTISPECIES: ATP phosphoribosyltransferase regulatory subunit [Moorella]PRR68960.1 ATP phosphoribosyltransferase regulatory subunit [Moorella stamsii]CEP67581.1 Histidine-tRNA ligase/ATP phosphoribosyltransferase regulatory subunit [Moorella glycerini]